MTNKQTINSNVTSSQQSIVVILESPHISEFNFSGKGIMPLVNDSLFVKEFGQAFSTSQSLMYHNIQLNTNTKYLVYLINAIQYQCSLGVPTEYFRDYIFLYYWGQKYQDFETRLQNLLNNNTIAIINLCTKGTHKLCQHLYNASTCQFDKMYLNCGIRFMNKLGFNFPRGKVKNLQDLVEKSVNYIIQNMPFTIPYTTGKHPYHGICIKLG